MSPNKISSKAKQLIKSACVAAVLPVFFIYILIAKPDYKIMNGLAHIVLPVASFVGDVITWPVRAIGNTAQNIRELSNLREENEELRYRLDDALQNKYLCDIAVLENQKLSQELDIVQNTPRTTTVADVMFDNKAFNHNTFLINRGDKNGIKKGMVVTSMHGMLVGVIIDVANGFSRVRSLTDSDTNIAVRIAGSDVYGFLSGNGSDFPTVGFFSDPLFQATDNLSIITSSIGGVLPNNIIIGTTINDTDVQIKTPSELSRVLILDFDNNNTYK